MISLDLIKNELEDIKYYYSRKDMFDKAFNSVCFKSSKGL